MDFAAEGLLDGLEGEEREARRQLLERLADEGVPLEELRAAVAEDRLPLVPVERALGACYTAAEVEERTGFPAAMVLRFWRLLGLPEARPQDRVFGDEDIAAAESIRFYLEAGLSEEGVVEITRVLGESMARLAPTTAAAFADAFLEPGDSELDVADRFTTLAQKLRPAIAPVLMAAYTAHLRDSIRRGIIGRAEREAGHLAGEEEIAVCFADLVGFTRLGAEIDTEQLGNVVGSFATLAADAARPPVRLVKTIGDAALFVSPEPAAAVEAALALIEAAETADLPSVRAGVAYGSVLQRAGDFYGHAVNLASRVTGIARPGSVLCTEEVYKASKDAFDLSFARRYRLKGIGDAVALYRARRPGAEAEASPKSKEGRRRR